MISRSSRRRTVMGLQTLLGRSAKGFFIPYRYADHTARPRGHDRYGALSAFFERATPQMREIINDIETYAAHLLNIGGDPPPAPRFEQDWFPRLDAAVAYAMIRARRPKRLVEVGSGHSTRFFVRAAADQGDVLDLTAIDPAPRADVSKLPIRLISSTLQVTGASPFRDVRPGDVVSIDSSHVFMPGTDVDILLNEILPTLAKGVLVHIHDIFLPGDYPASWGWRGYNEQLGVAALLHGGSWRVLWSSQYVLQTLPNLLTGSVIEQLPLVPGAFEASLWLEKA